MRVIQATVAVLIATLTPVHAGETLLIDKGQSATDDSVTSAQPVADKARAVTPSAAAPADTPKPKRKGPFPAIYDSPVFSKTSDSDSPVVDESALRYYASQKNHVRVDAEIRRLKALYPSWHVPTNLYTPAGNGNGEQPLWDLFAANKMDQLNAAVSLRMLQDSGWRPSADLASKIEIRVATDRLVQASDAKAWTRVLDVANATPVMLTCANIDADWRVAEAFAATNAMDRSFEVDRAILSSCTDRDQRLATVRKAVAVLPVAKVELLIAMGAALADGSHEFDAVRIDLVRGALGKFASGDTTDQVPAEALKLFADSTTASGNGADATLLGWYNYRLKAWADADEWFKAGLVSLPDDPKLQEGHVLSLRNLDKVDEARKLAYQWRAKSPALQGLYTGFVVQELTREKPAPTISAAEVAEFTTSVNQTQSWDGAQALAWFNYNRKNWEGAAGWFKLSTDWAVAAQAADKIDPKTVAGHALALNNLGRFEEAEAVAYPACAGSSDVRKIYINIAISQMTKPGQPVVLAADRLGRYADVVKQEHSQAGAAALAWYNLGANDFAQAIDWFSASNVWSGDGKGDMKSNEGLALALKGAGRFEAAEDLAYDWIDRSPDLRAVYRDTVVVELTRDDLAAGFSEGRLTRFESVVEKDKLAGGAQALGWYRLNQQGCGYAVGWFHKAIAWSPDHQGDEKVNEGFAQALQTVGRYAEAEDVAYAWKDRSPDLKAIFVKLAVDVLTRQVPAIPTTEARVARYAEVIASTRSANGAQAIAWYRYRDTLCGYGSQWFAWAQAWSPDQRGDAKTNEGYALSLRQVGKLAAAEEVLYPWVDRVPVMRGIYIDVTVSELTGDNPPMPMDDARMARFVRIITPLRDPLGAQAIAWYRHARTEDAEAAKWFKTAIDWWPSLSPDAQAMRDPVLDDYQPVTAKLALVLPDYRRTPRAYGGRTSDRARKGRAYVDTFTGLATTWTGYVMALTATGRTAEAETIAYDWRDRWPAMHDLFVNLVVSTLTKPNGPDLPADQLKRYVDMIGADHLAGGAQALGWYYSNHQNWDEAVVWFKAAIDWRSASPNAETSPDVALETGYIVALRHLKRFDEAMALAEPLRGLSPAMAALYLDTSLDQLSNGGTNAAPPERLADLTSGVNAAHLPGGALSLGWYFYGQKDFVQALTWFRSAVTWVPDGRIDPKAAQGLALTYRALGRNGDALTFASAWRERVPSLSEVLPIIVVDMLTQDKSTVTLPADQLAKITTLVSTDKSVPGATAMAWNAYTHKDWTSAADWFHNAMTWSPNGKSDAKIAEGYASALRNLGRYDESEAISYAWYDSPDGAALRTAYVDTVAERLARAKPPVSMSTQELQKFATAVLATQSANGAQALGWYSYNSAQFRPAVAWFVKALAWEESEGEALGLALSYRRANDTEAYNNTIETYRDKYPRIGELLRGGKGRDRSAATDRTTTQPAQDTKVATAQPAADPEPVADEPRRTVRGRPSVRAPKPEPASTGGGSDAAAALHAKDYSRCLERVGADERGGRGNAGLMQIKGWCLLGLNRPDEAALAFSRAQNGQAGKSTGDAAFGQSLSLLQSGKVDAAAQVANTASLTSSRRNDIGLQVMTQRVYADYSAQRWRETLDDLNRRAAYAPESRDLSMARGWCLFHLGDLDASQRVFTQANAILSDAESQRALNLIGIAANPRRNY